MGNRAVITTKGAMESKIGIYLHWNGGRDSVEAFLKYCELRGFRSPTEDCYGWARLAQVIGNFFGGALSVGVDLASKLDYDNWDNGTYIIDGWKIVDREFFDGAEQCEYDLKDMLLDIDARQPTEEQLGREFLEAEELMPCEIEVGDKVYVPDWNGTYVLYNCVGIGEDKIVNGRNVKNIPYVDHFYNNGGYSTNTNNYLYEYVYRVIRK